MPPLQWKLKELKGSFYTIDFQANRHESLGCALWVVHIVL